MYAGMHACMKYVPGPCSIGIVLSLLALLSCGFSYVVTDFSPRSERAFGFKVERTSKQQVHQDVLGDLIFRQLQCGMKAEMKASRSIVRVLAISMNTDPKATEK